MTNDMQMTVKTKQRKKSQKNRHLVKRNIKAISSFFTSFGRERNFLVPCFNFLFSRYHVFFSLSLVSFVLHYFYSAQGKHKSWKWETHTKKFDFTQLSAYLFTWLPNVHIFLCIFSRSYTGQSARGFVCIH